MSLNPAAEATAVDAAVVDVEAAPAADDDDAFGILIFAYSDQTFL